MAITLNSFTAGQVIVAADMNTNFNNINSWSDTVALKAGAAFTGNVTITSGTFTVGANTAGDDVKFFGDTSGAYMLWDADTDDLILAGAARVVVPDGQLVLGSTAVTSTAAELNILDGVTATASEINLLDGSTAGTVVASKAVVASADLDIASFRNVTLTGELVAATLDISGDVDIDGTTNLDNVQIDGTITLGANDTGYDVVLYGNTADMRAHWDTSQNALAITSSSAALRIVDTHANSAPYIGFYDSSYTGDVGTGRLGYVGYPNNDDLYIRNEDLDGHVYIISQQTISIQGTISGTNSIPRMSYRGDGAAVLPTHQMNSVPTIFICTTQPTATSTGDIWIDI